MNKIGRFRINDYPQRDLPPIDRLEGFRSGRQSMYQRVMVAVLRRRTAISASTYWMTRVDNVTQLDTGVWYRV
ncbi:gamma-glutamylcyclotransferase [Nitrosomonas nitrosa]|uniref:gamma-glutamylcyclotransferase n=1 Tax=Nitrosomonas nitrosa TaxID=52442 RepID=UPI0019597D5B|nr:gamma-glutamylcyclotransferase [Nitrosomonas nitrosa]